jgi:DNA-binding NtrC family response regulator
VFPEAEHGGEAEEEPVNFQEATRRFQRRYVLEALERNDWNVAETARQLELARSHLYNLINEFGLKRNGGEGRGRA